MEVVYYPKEKNCYANRDIVSWAKANNLDYICEIHRNAGGGYGYETLVKGGADNTDNAIHNAIVGLGFRDRGIKLRTDLYNMNAINGICSYSLIEIGFIDSTDDNNLFDKNLEAIGNAIYSACESTGKTRVGIICGHGQGDPGASAFGRREDLDVRKINVTSGGQTVVEPITEKPESTPATPKGTVTYQAYVPKKWLANVVNQTDYAGLPNQAIQCVQANSNIGRLKYRVHINGGNWLPWVIDRTDFAGIKGKNIDGIQCQLLDVPGVEVKYRVSLIGTAEYLPTVTGLEDFAGIYGRTFDEIQIWI